MPTRIPLKSGGPKARRAVLHGERSGRARVALPVAALLMRPRPRRVWWPAAFESACWASWRSWRAQRPSSSQRQWRGPSPWPTQAVLPGPAWRRPGPIERKIGPIWGPILRPAPTLRITSTRSPENHKQPWRPRRQRRDVDDANGGRREGLAAFRAVRKIPDPFATGHASRVLCAPRMSVVTTIGGVFRAF
jgi:hypothetical protein